MISGCETTPAPHYGAQPEDKTVLTNGDPSSQVTNTGKLNRGTSRIRTISNDLRPGISLIIYIDGDSSCYLSEYCEVYAGENEIEIFYQRNTQKGKGQEAADTLGKIFAVFSLLGGGFIYEGESLNPTQKCNPVFKVTTEAGSVYRLVIRPSSNNKNTVEFFIEEENTGKVLAREIC